MGLNSASTVLGVAFRQFPSLYISLNTRDTGNSAYSVGFRKASNELLITKCLKINAGHTMFNLPPDNVELNGRVRTHNGLAFEGLLFVPSFLPSFGRWDHQRNYRQTESRSWELGQTAELCPAHSPHCPAASSSRCFWKARHCGWVRDVHRTTEHKHLTTHRVTLVEGVRCSPPPSICIREGTLTVQYFTLLF